MWSVTTIACTLYVVHRIYFHGISSDREEYTPWDSFIHSLWKSKVRIAVILIQSDKTLIGVSMYYNVY